MNRRDALKLIGAGSAAATVGVLAMPQDSKFDAYARAYGLGNPYTGIGWDAFLAWMTRHAQPQECHRQYAGRSEDNTPVFRGNLTSVVGAPKSGKSTVMTMLARHWTGTKDLKSVGRWTGTEDSKVWASGFVPSGADAVKQVEFALQLVNREHSLTRGQTSHLNVLLEQTLNRDATCGKSPRLIGATLAVADVTLHVERVETGRMASDIPGGRRCDGMRITVVSNRWGPTGDRFYVSQQDIQAEAMNNLFVSWGYNLQWYSHVHQQLEDAQNRRALKGVA